MANFLTSLASVLLSVRRREAPVLVHALKDEKILYMRLECLESSIAAKTEYQSIRISMMIPFGWISYGHRFGLLQKPSLWKRAIS